MISKNCFRHYHHTKSFFDNPTHLHNHNVFIAKRHNLPAEHEIVNHIKTSSSKHRHYHVIIITSSKYHNYHHNYWRTNFDVINIVISTTLLTTLNIMIFLMSRFFGWLVGSKICVQNFCNMGGSLRDHRDHRDQPKNLFLIIESFLKDKMNVMIFWSHRWSHHVLGKFWQSGHWWQNDEWLKIMIIIYCFINLYPLLLMTLFNILFLYIHLSSLFFKYSNIRFLCIDLLISELKM